MKTKFVHQSLSGYILTILLFIVLTFIITKKMYSQVNEDAIVTIIGNNGDLGTGFVTAKGVYTSYHVIDEMDTIYVVYRNGKKTEALLRKKDTIKDIVLLLPLFPEKTTILEFSDANIKPLDEVTTIGHPFGIKYMHYKGYIHKVMEDSFIASFDIYGGISGAPVLYKGKVCGIVRAYHTAFSITFINKMNYENYN